MPTLYWTVGIERWIYSLSSLNTFSKTYLLLKAHLFTLTSLLKQRSISLLDGTGFSCHLQKIPSC